MVMTIRGQPSCSSVVILLAGFSALLSDGTIGYLHGACLRLGRTATLSQEELPNRACGALALFSEILAGRLPSPPQHASSRASTGLSSLTRHRFSPSFSISSPLPWSRRRLQRFVLQWCDWARAFLNVPSPHQGNTPRSPPL